MEKACLLKHIYQTTRHQNLEAHNMNVSDLWRFNFWWQVTRRMCHSEKTMDNLIPSEAVRSISLTSNFTLSFDKEEAAEDD